MLNIFSLLRGESFLGIDIGTTSIKMVEVVHPPKGAKPELRTYGWLETYGYLERFNNALQTSSLKLFEKEIANYLKILLNHTESKTDLVVASLPAFTAFSTLIELPMMPNSEIVKTMSFQLKKYIPLPISAVTIDWIKVGEKTDEDGNELQQVFIVSIPNEHIERLKSVFKLVGLKLVDIEVEGMSMARSLTTGIQEPTLIIDIGARSTSISVAKNGYLKMSGQTDFAGGSITQSLSSGLNITTRRAEDLKKQKGLSVEAGDYELSTLMFPMLDAIINEVGRVRTNYEDIYKEKISRAILSGGGSNLLGIEKYLKDQIELPIERANPFKNISYPQNIEPVIKDIGPSLSVAIGLGLRGRG